VSLTNVSCGAVDACLALGTILLGSGNDEPFVEQWNGYDWAVQSVPIPAGASLRGLSGVSCTSRDACTIVGNYYTSATNAWTTLAERWDGSSWTVQPTPNAPWPARSGLSGVSCSAENACTAVGSVVGSGPLAEAWNGSAWVIQPTPSPPGGLGSTLNVVSCTAPGGCTAVGGASLAGPPLVERWDGSAWTIEQTPAVSGQPALGGVSCSATDACTAVGWTTAGSSTSAVAESWNGNDWVVQPTPAA
jgi:hypothetical protein